MKILHAPVNVGNQPWVLSRYERKLGLHSDLVVNYSTWLNYPADRILGDYGKRNPAAIGTRLCAGLTAPFRYDVLHYYFGRSLLTWDDWAMPMKVPFADLKLARRLGKKIFMTLQGCDVRIAARSNAANEYTPCAEGVCRFYENCVANVDATRLEMIDAILPLCDKVFFLNPELGHFVPDGEFLPYCSVDIHEFDFAPSDLSRKPRIVHAPSDGNVKGTPRILAALETLRSEFEFELILVENTPYEEAIELYKSADIAIDQLMAGWYGGVAVELMAMGKPVLCYLREQDFAYLPPAMRADLPLVNMSEDSLVDDLRRVLQQREQWPLWAERSRKFVETWHNPVIIAERMQRLYADPALPLFEDTGSV